MKRRMVSLLVALLLVLSLASCGGRNILLFLNWGEYIDEALIEKFEEEYNCTVYMDLGESNEIFYSKVRGGTTVYDVVCPSDYMIEKMYNNNMLHRLDLTKLPAYTALEERVGVKAIKDEMIANTNADIVNHFVPYLWGTWGIMYSTTKEGLEDAVINSENEWSCLFDRNVLPQGTKVAMYDSHQHAYYAACKYLDKSSNNELPQSELNQIRDLVVDMNYDAWGTDNIKKDIVAGNIDVGFMWTGDFLYYYCENIANIVMEAYLNGEINISEFEAMINTLTSNERIYTKNNKSYNIGFDLTIPEDSIAFCDNLAITKDSSHKDLAYEFINFMCSGEREIGEEIVEPAYANAYYVCYDTPFNSIFDQLVDLRNEVFTEEDLSLYQEEKNDGVDDYDSSLYWKIYDYATGIAFDKYYQKDGSKGDILATFSRGYVNIINTTFNNARA